MDIFLFTFIIVIFYILILFLCKYFNLGRKKACNNCNNCCPDCSSSLNRIKRINLDKIVNYITFRIFDYKRYFCSECGWEGLKWEDNFK